MQEVQFRLEVLAGEAVPQGLHRRKLIDDYLLGPEFAVSARQSFSAVAPQIGCWTLALNAGGFSGDCSTFDPQTCA